MCDIGIYVENFNPTILYIFKSSVNHDSKVSTHCHDYLEIKYLLSGTGTYSINNDFYPVKKGNLIICNPGTEHRKHISQEEEMTELNIGISNVYIKGMSNGFLIDADTCPVINPIKYEADILRCCSEILSEQEKNEPGNEIIQKALVMKLIVLFLKEMSLLDLSSDNPRISFESNEKTCIVNTIISYINENYMKDISLERIARNMYLSPVYISKIFKEETGESPINYLIKVRLSKASEMLKEGNSSVKTVAKNIGYHDAYYFSKLFKKYYGFPPSKQKAV